MNHQSPKWKIPNNLIAIIEEDGQWETDRWFPITLTVLGETVYRDKDIPLSWQIEFEPADSYFDLANFNLRALGYPADGYGWADFIKSQIKHSPEIVNEVQFGDTEDATCVIWVESELACKNLMKLVWDLIHF